MPVNRRVLKPLSASQHRAKAGCGINDSLADSRQIGFAKRCRVRLQGYGKGKAYLPVGHTGARKAIEQRDVGDQRLFPLIAFFSVADGAQQLFGRKLGWGQKSKIAVYRL